MGDNDGIEKNCVEIFGTLPTLEELIENRE